MKDTIEGPIKARSTKKQSPDKAGQSDASTHLLATPLQLAQRRVLMDKFLSREWGTEGPSGNEKKLEWARP